MRMNVPTAGSRRSRYRRTDLRHAAHHGRCSEDRDEPLGGVDAVLQRDDRGVGADQRPDMLVAFESTACCFAVMRPRRDSISGR